MTVIDTCLAVITELCMLWIFFSGSLYSLIKIDIFVCDPKLKVVYILIPFKFLPFIDI